MANDYDALPQKLDLRNLQVRELIGESSSASFWRTTYNGHDVALKSLKALNLKSKSLTVKPSPATAANGFSKQPPEADLPERIFLREAEITMQLDHKNIVRCFGVMQLPGGSLPNQGAPALAVAMELCERQTLKELITRSMATGKRVYKMAEAYQWLVQLSSALAYLHERKPPIIHRDIRVDGILLKRSGSGSGADVASGMICKLSDFGLHAVLYEDRSNALRRRAFTQTHINPLADSSNSSGRHFFAGEGGDTSLSASSMSEASRGRATAAAASKEQATGVAGQKPSASGGEPTSPDKSCRDGSMLQGAPVGGEACPAAPAAALEGLGTVASLLRQLGMSEIKPLSPVDVEWVYSLPGKAKSFLYMAPEVYNNLPYSERSDVFAFGVLAYEVLAGEVLSISVFSTAKAEKMGISGPHGYAARVAKGYRPARIRAIPDAAWNLIETCWHPDPAQRPPMSQVQAELQILLEKEMEEAAGGRGDGGGGYPWALSGRSSGKGLGSPVRPPRRPPVDGPFTSCAKQCLIS